MQYAGYRSYAAIQVMRGEAKSAETSLRNASEMKALINQKWWNDSGSYFYSYIDTSGSFKGKAGADLLYRNAADDGPRTKAALKSLLEKERTEPASAVEPKSHYAEILYRYGSSDAAYAEIMDLSRAGRERQEYPEVSYSVVGAIVNGLMGINTRLSESIEDATHGSGIETIVETLPQLTANTHWVELRNLPVQDDFITVRQEEKRLTFLANQGGSDLVWQAAFPGSFRTLIVNGKSQPAHTETRNPDRAITWVRVKVQAGTSARVEVPRE
jgi:hypothetical protein